MRKKCISKDAEKNPAVLSAIAIFHNYKKGYKINDNFFFNPELESLGKWYRQLMGESIGKEKNIFNKTVHIGITPTVSIGSTDLHSVGQLYLGGPKDKYTNFIWIKQASEIAVPKKRIFPKLIEQITAKTAKTILNAILRGVKIAYTKQNLPFSETTLEENSEKHIGEYMQFKMMEIMFLANLLKINAFDQPNVENYKKETKKILNS
jgi:glucose-6-phosphate isomerase